MSAATLGLGALLVAWHPVFVAVKWIGITYLAYLGVRLFLAGGDAFTVEPAGAERRAFRFGLATQLANPKVILFFGALLPQFVDPARPAAPQFALLGATFILSDALVFYGALAHRARVFLTNPARRASPLGSAASRCSAWRRGSPPNAERRGLVGNRLAHRLRERIERGEVELYDRVRRRVRRAPSG